MDEKKIVFDRSGYSRRDAAKFLFLDLLRERFWFGFLAGLIVMSMMNVGDVHLCIGECDAQGLSFWQAFDR